MRLRLLVIALAVLFGVSSCSTPGDGLNVLPGPWEYSPGTSGDSLVAARGYHYRALTVFTGFESLVPDGRGILWVRTRPVIPEGLSSQPLSLLISSIIPADQIFFDGHFIGGQGSFPEKGRVFFSDWNRPRKYDLPPHTAARGDGMLYIRIFVNYEGSINGTAFIGPRSEVDTQYRLADFKSGIHLLLSFLMAFIAGYFLLIFLKRRRDLENLHYGLSVLFFAVFEINFFVTRLPFDISRYLSYLLFQKIVYASACIGLLFLIQFIHDFYRIRARMAVKVFFFLVCVIPAAALLLLLEYQSMVRYGKLFPAVVAGFSLAYLFARSIGMVMKGNRNAAVVLAGLVLFMVGVAHDIARHVIWVQTDAPYTSVIGFTFFLISISFILANSFVNAHNQVEILLVDLARKSGEQQRAEEDLSAEKERLAVTLDSIADGVIATDIEGRVVIMNGNAERLTGMAHGDACGRELDLVLTVEAGGEGCPGGVFQSIRRTGKGGEFNCEMPARDNEPARFIAGSGAPIMNRDGRAQGYVFVLRDVTEDMKLQNEILKVKKLESIGVLAGGIAHDFNNMLMAIVANISLAKMLREGDVKVHELLDDAENACMRAKGLTHQLLTFSRGGAPVRRISSIESIVRDSTGFVLRGTSARCSYRFADALWAVNADADQMSQVMQNLVINASQAMPDGGRITVAAENAALTAGHGIPLPDGNYVKITISDTGMGIAPHNLSRIFDPYFTTKETGSGLGLASVYSIVKKHEGHIGVTSQMGEGTLFTLWLPAVADTRNNEHPAQSPVTSLEGRVLVMDDDPEILKILTSMLGELGLAAVTAADGAEALAHYASAAGEGRPFDAVILDLTIPGGMGGRETIARLLAMDPAVKAIVSSGYSTSPVMADYRRHGFCGVIGKPYRIEELFAELKRILLP